MKKLIDDFEKIMAIKNFSKSTQKSYYYNLKKFLEHCQKENKKIDSGTFKDYLFNLIKKNNLSSTALKQSIGAVKFFLSTHLTFLMN